MFKFIFPILISLFIIPAFAEDPPVEAKGWTPWVSLGGQIKGDPAACTAGNITFVVARGSENKIWYRKRYLPTGVWTTWKELDYNAGSTSPQGGFTGAPAIYCWQYYSQTSVVVSAIGVNNRVYSNYGWGSATMESFSNWAMETAFNAASFSGPSYAGWPAANLRHLFARGGDNRIYWKTSFTGASPYFQLLISEPVYNDVAAVMSSSSRLDFFYRDQNGRLWQQFMVGTMWQPRQQIIGATYSAPEVVSRNQSSLDLFAKGVNNTMMHRRSMNGIWGPWVSLGGQVTSGPGATTYANNQRIFLFARWSNGQLYYRAWAP